MDKSQKRLMIFIDNSNLFWAMSQYRKGYRIDILKLIERLTDVRDLIRTYYFASTKVPPLPKQTAFYELLNLKGITTVIKTLRFGKEKGVDVALTKELLCHAFRDTFDDAIVVSGDQDYVEAIKEVKNLGKRVEVVTFRSCLARDLQLVADRVVFLESITGEIELIRQTKGPTVVVGPSKLSTGGNPPG